MSNSLTEKLPEQNAVLDKSRGTHRQMPRYGVGGGGGASGLLNTIFPKPTFLVFDGTNEFQLTFKARFNVGES